MYFSPLIAAGSVDLMYLSLLITAGSVEQWACRAIWALPFSIAERLGQRRQKRGYYSGTSVLDTHGTGPSILKLIREVSLFQRTIVLCEFLYM